MKRSFHPWLLTGWTSAFLALTPGLLATTYAPAGIESDEILVQDGNVVFVQPGGSVTVLDAATGAVRLRTPPPKKRAGRYQLLRTEAGILVSSSESFWMLDLVRPAIAWSINGCYGRFHLTRQGLLCFSTEGWPIAPGVRLTLHRLQDGKAVWTYPLKNPSGGEVLDGRGRLMLTYEDRSERETFPAGTGTLVQPVRRVVALTILDLASGRELLPPVAQDVKLDGQVEQPIRFDGDRITYVVRRAADDPCRGEHRRVLTLKSAASAFSVDEKCEHQPKVAADEDGPPKSACYISSKADQQTRRLPSGTVTLETFEGGTLVDVTSCSHRWLAGIPSHSSLAPELGLIREDGGLLFLESQSMAAGRLDALDVKTGRPLWTYIFPSFRVMASTTGFLAALEPWTLPADNDRAWATIRSDPPGGAFPVPLEALPAHRPSPRNRVPPAGAVPVRLDPGVAQKNKERCGAHF